MPLFVEVDAPIRVPSDAGELLVDAAQLGQPIGGDVARKLQRQTFEAGEDGTGLPHLGCIEGAYAEPPTHVGLQDAFAGQAEQGLPHRGSAHAQLARHLGVPDPGPWGEISPGDAVEELAIDFVAERRAGDDEVLTGSSCILYTVFTSTSQEYGGYTALAHYCPPASSVTGMETAPNRSPSRGRNAGPRYAPDIQPCPPARSRMSGTAPSREIAGPPDSRRLVTRPGEKAALAEK